MIAMAAIADGLVLMLRRRAVGDAGGLYEGSRSPRLPLSKCSSDGHAAWNYDGLLTGTLQYFPCRPREGCLNTGNDGRARPLRCSHKRVALCFIILPRPFVHWEIQQLSLLSLLCPISSCGFAYLAT